MGNGISLFLASLCASATIASKNADPYFVFPCSKTKFGLEESDEKEGASRNSIDSCCMCACTRNSEVQEMRERAVAAEASLAKTRDSLKALRLKLSTFLNDEHKDKLLLDSLAESSWFSSQESASRSLLEKVRVDLAQQVLDESFSEVLFNPVTSLRRSLSLNFMDELRDVSDDSFCIDIERDTNMS